MRWVLLLALAACSGARGTSNGSSMHGPGDGQVGPGNGQAGPGDGQAGPGRGSFAGDATTCEGVRPRVEKLYRADAQLHEPKRVLEAVADNTAMVMADCGKAPAKTAACLARVTSVAELERQCLVPLDDEGTEGEALAR